MLTVGRFQNQINLANANNTQFPQFNFNTFPSIDGVKLNYEEKKDKGKNKILIGSGIVAMLATTVLLFKNRNKSKVIGQLKSELKDTKGILKSSEQKLSVKKAELTEAKEELNNVLLEKDKLRKQNESLSIENGNLKREKFLSKHENALRCVAPENREIAIEVLPHLVENDGKLRLMGRYDRFLESVNANNKDFVINETIPLLAENLGKMGLSSHSHLHKFLGAITPENKEYFKKLTEKTRELNLHEGMYVRDVLGMINPENKDYVFDEAIPLVLQHKSKFKKVRGYGVVELLKALISKPEGKDRLETKNRFVMIVNNPKAFHVKDDFFPTHLLTQTQEEFSQTLKDYKISN